MIKFFYKNSLIFNIIFYKIRPKFSIIFIIIILLLGSIKFFKSIVIKFLERIKFKKRNIIFLRTQLLKELVNYFLQKFKYFQLKKICFN